MKFKSIHKDGNSYIYVKCDKNQSITQWERQIISKGKAPYLFNADIMENGKKIELMYDITGYISVRSFLSDSIDLRSFHKLLENILLCLKHMNEIYFDMKYILFDIDNVYVRPENLEIGMVAVPIQYFDNNNNIRNFFLDIADNSYFYEDDDAGFVQEYIQILNDGINISLYELENYLKQLGDFLRKKKNMKISTEIDKINNSEEKIPDKYFEVGANANKKEKLYICREATGEKVEIEGEVFVIGHDSSKCNYAVKNGTISKKHIAIMSKQNDYYMVDLNSTNGIYVDGKKLTPESQYLIEDGMSIIMGDEKFTFEKRL